MQAPLKGIRVIDFTRVLSGPYTTMMLYDFGAEVIKIENPKGGDDSRAFAPFDEEGNSLYFASFNRGKKSISLNLKEERAKEIALKLIANADIVVENFRPGTMERLGLGYEVLAKINPKLIYASVSGFGHTGPTSALPAYDILAQARGGVMSLTGWEGSPPTRVGTSIGDITAGIFAVNGVLLALYQRTVTGKGQKIDISMLDCQIALLENALVRYQSTGEAPNPLGNRHPSLSPFQAFKAKDNYFVIAVGNDSLWSKLCSAIGREDLINDTRFISNDLRTQNIATLEEEISPLLASKTASEWLEIIGKAGIPCSSINDIASVMNDAQLNARNMFVPMGDFKLAGNPVKMSELPEAKEYPPPPYIGQDNKDILTALGYNIDEIEILRKEGVI